MFILKRLLFVTTLFLCCQGTSLTQKVGVASLDQLVVAINANSLDALQPFLDSKTHIGTLPAQLTPQALTQIFPQIAPVTNLKIVKQVNEGDNIRYTCNLTYHGQAHPCDFLLMPTGKFIDLNLVQVSGGPSDASTAAKLSVGQPAFAFTGRTMDGKAVKFPQDYKGKLVLLDFWATWCKPCRMVTPDIVIAYNKYHNKGLEILSVSLDDAGKTTEIKKCLAEDKVTWPQVYDGKGPLTAVARTYGIQGIPQLYLVDGTTGKIVGMKTGAGNESVEETVKKAFSVLKTVKDKHS